MASDSLGFSVSIHDRQSERRELAETFIAVHYQRSYGCSVVNHYPTLISVSDEQGRVAGAVGLRFAADESLFLEQYLDRPVELALSSGLLRTVARHQVAEIGSLASSSRNGTLRLFEALAAYLSHQQLDYAAVTATEPLRRLLGRLGITTIDLGAAQAGALPTEELRGALIMRPARE